MQAGIYNIPCKSAIVNGLADFPVSLTRMSASHIISWAASDAARAARMCGGCRRGLRPRCKSSGVLFVSSVIPKGEINSMHELAGTRVPTPSRGVGAWLVSLAAVTFMGLLPSVAFAGEAINLPKFDKLDLMWPSIEIVLGCAIFGLIFGAMWFRAIMREDPGSKGMVEVSRAVQEGAWAYLMRQMKTMSVFVIIIAIGLILLYRPLPEFQARGVGGVPVYVGIALAFILGVAASYGAGLIGMMMAVRANARVANAALSSFKRALYIAFRAGGVSGMATVGLGLMGACLVFFMFEEQSMKVLIGFGFGGCLAALFMRIGGGIYTKAADVGADRKSVV